jgi:hypothetical protein
VQLVVGYSPDSKDVSAEAEESPLLEAVTRKRLVKTQQTEKLGVCYGDFVNCGDQRRRYS